MDAFRLLYASHVRPRLGYGSAATYLCTVGELAKLERVQRAATRLVVGQRGTSYEGRLQATGLFPVAYRRVRGDFICLRKILKGDMGPEFQQYFPLWIKHRPLGHCLTSRKLQSVGLPLVY
ncbi:unnamed protein product [Echinostoma caproni]|uniref:FGF n=1 Tax=Echinostoma caproni TaxID=27848 RepID=A0A183B1D1_9TREM|nr:unnamed protein product [Echinostoma caproni]